MKSILFFVMFLFNVWISFAQVEQQWVARYTGTGAQNDFNYAMTLDASGNTYVTGITNHTNGTDVATIKYNTSGEQVWLRIFDGGNPDAAYDITTDNSGNVYITGASFYDMMTVKYNSSGVQQWWQYYDGPFFDDDGASAVAVDNSGNVYVTGWSTGIQTAFDITTIKYNASGVEQWVIRYGAGGDDAAADIAIDGSGNIYVTGYANGDYATIKYNPAGVQQWIASYNGPTGSSDYAVTLKIDGSGNIYITGSSLTSGTDYDYATIKYNSAGVQQWAQRFNGPASTYDYATDMTVDAAGNVYVTGNSFADIATVKYNTAGVQQWVQMYNGQANAIDQGYSIAVDGTGNVYVSGQSYINTAFNYDFLTVKYNAAGSQQWTQTYNGPGSFIDNANTVAVDAGGNVYVSGQSAGNGTSFDYATIKYSPLIGIEPVSTEVPDDYMLSQNFPNPFNPVTKIKFSIKGSSYGSTHTVINVYDITGRKISALVNESLQAGEYEILFDGSDFSSGIYYYTILAGDFRDTKKMILIK